MTSVITPSASSIVVITSISIVVVRPARRGMVLSASTSLPFAFITSSTFSEVSYSFVGSTCMPDTELVTVIVYDVVSFENFSGSSTSLEVFPLTVETDRAERFTRSSTSTSVASTVTLTVPV